MDYCGRLFHLEKGFSEQELSFQERYQARLEQSKPLAEKFFAWAAAEYEKNPVPKSMLGAALTYAVDKKARLMNVFLDGRVELSNNRVERAVRPFAVGRKNWLFSNTPKGADASAAVYSIGLGPLGVLPLLLLIPLGHFRKPGVTDLLAHVVLRELLSRVNFNARAACPKLRQAARVL